MIALVRHFERRTNDLPHLNVQSADLFALCRRAMQRALPLQEKVGQSIQA